MRSYWLLPLLVVVLTACSPAQDPGLYPVFDPAKASAIPEKTPTRYNPQRNLYWGDLHIHTSYSTDAWTMGVRATPDDAYTFTRGGEIEHAGGYGIRMKRPLDFAAVTDHGEYLGLLSAKQPDLPLRDRSFAERLRSDGPLANTIALLRTTYFFSLENVDSEGWQEHARSAWDDSLAAAERHYQPGTFTTFAAYEWTSFPDSQNLHRNVIYKSSAVPELPYSSLDSEDPRALWAELERQRERGMDNFAIPHNGNVSNGLMYDSVAFDGEAMDSTYAQTRMRNEPISEIFQIKGSSETHPALSPGDEFAGFEIVDELMSREAGPSLPEGGYFRDALRRGIEMSHAEGFNPYRFGVIGSSDSHNASSSVEEDNHHGKLPILDGSASTRLRTSIYMPQEMPGGTIWSSAGLAAVWAQENTRESLFEAMRRKETFATSGPRMLVRFFGAWDYSPDLFTHIDWVHTAELTGVPMGGDMPVTGRSEAPTFAVWAIRDPLSGNLDRVQIIKGWLLPDGSSRERVFDVAWSDDRELGADGRLLPVGNTVDVNNASYANTIGAEQLKVVWVDPEFDPTVEAFYYARVIEIPTPRWSTYDAKALGLKAPEPTALQERAVTSPIWYRP